MKIKELYIKSFRGIPNECVLEFVDRNDKPISSIIYGGNGSGKSSIIDAIEYCLQGKIERSDEIKNKNRPSAINFSNKKYINPSVKIIFDDDSEIQRDIIIVEEEDMSIRLLKSSASPHDAYANSPIVLRRNDIISYNITPEVQRQILMLQFVYTAKIKSKLSEDPEVRILDEEDLKLRDIKNEIRRKISQLTNLSMEDLGNNSNNLEGFIRSKFSPKGQKFGITKNGFIKKHINVSEFNKILGLVDEFNIAFNKQKKIKAEKRKLTTVSSPERFSILSETFKEASKYLTSAFKEISSIDYVEDIQLSVANVSLTSLAINIHLINGKTVTPNQIFSEANYDLMVLLLYLSLIRVGVDRGQEKVLILDDVLQSVDSNIRANFIAYILKELKDWQLFITCHDRLWLSQLKYLFQRSTHKFKEYHISNWSFLGGPNIREENLATIDNTLSQAITTRNVRIIAAISGLFLEKICQELSVSLACSIERKPGDKYTIGDLWPSVKKTLKKTGLNHLLEIIDKSLCIRNLLGCHYNQWAEAFSDEEVLEFAITVQELYEKVFCEKCMSWITKSRTKGVVGECNCKRLTY